MDYNSLKKSVSELENKLKAAKIRVDVAEVLPPIGQDKIDEIEQNGLTLPESLKKFLTTVCSGIRISWMPDDNSQFPAELQERRIFGNCEWSYDALFDTGLRDDMTDCWSISEDSGDNEKIWLTSLTLCNVGGGGDYLILDTTQNDWPVLFYDHMGGYEGGMVAKNLEDLLIRQMQMAFADVIEYKHNWVTEDAETKTYSAPVLKWAASL